MDKSPIVIIGAGMGGLVAALALQKLGLKAQVFEQADELSEVGAGLTVSPNATRALEFLGLGDFLEQNADTPTSGALIHYKTGKVLTRTQSAGSFKDQFGAEYYQIHRADLHQELVNRVRKNDPNSILLNHKFKTLHQHNKIIELIFENGNTISSEVVIGADGSRSAVRGSIIDTTAPIFTGQVAFRGLVEAEKVKKFMTVANSTVTMGPDHIFTRYYLRHGKIVNVVAIAKTDAWKEEGWSIPATKSDLLREYKGWNKDVIGIIQAIDEKNLYKWALFDRDPISKWTVGSVTLLGDAAHPMLPFLGMGAAMALEDGIVCARCIKKYKNIKEALNQYESLRRERTNKVLLDSRVQGEWYQNTDPDTYKEFASTGEMRVPLMGYDPASIEV